MIDNMDSLSVDAEDPTALLTQSFATSYFEQAKLMWNAYQNNKQARLVVLSFIENLVEIAETFKFDQDAKEKVHKFLISVINALARPG